MHSVPDVAGSMAGCLLILCELLKASKVGTCFLSGFFDLDILNPQTKRALSASLPRLCQDGRVQVANKDRQNRQLLKDVSISISLLPHPTAKTCKKDI